MTDSDRWVLLGLAQARSVWFREVAQWATSATIAAEFVKCVSAEDVRARLGSGRVYSALLVDASLADFDRDLVGAATAARIPVIAVVDGRSPVAAPQDLGVSATLSSGFDHEALNEVLVTSAQRIGRGAVPTLLVDEVTSAWRGGLVVVCGTGGTGASSLSIALSQGMASDDRYGGSVVLADLARHADQAMLHDAGDLGPGIQELVEAHRTGHPGAAEVRAYTFEVPTRGYRLLLGLRRPAAWAALRPRATDAAVDALRRTFRLVVADVTGDLEGEAEGGSLDVEERNHLARTSVAQADVVVAVGTPGIKGVHSLAALVRDLAECGSASRVLPVVNRAPRHPGARSEIAAALGRLTGGLGALSTPLWIPDRRVDEALRHGTPLPQQVVAPLTAGVRAVLERAAAAHRPPAWEGAARVVPGSLGAPIDGSEPH